MQALRREASAGKCVAPFSLGDSYGKTMGKPWENGGLMRFNGFRWKIHWIDLREHLQESMVFTIKLIGLSCKIFPSSNSMKDGYHLEISMGCTRPGKLPQKTNWKDSPCYLAG